MLWMVELSTQWAIFHRPEKNNRARHAWLRYKAVVQGAVLVRHLIGDWLVEHVKAYVYAKCAYQHFLCLAMVMVMAVPISFLYTLPNASLEMTVRQSIRFRFRFPCPRPSSSLSLLSALSPFRFNPKPKIYTTRLNGARELECRCNDAMSKLSFSKSTSCLSVAG